MIFIPIVIKSRHGIEYNEFVWNEFITQFESLDDSTVTDSAAINKLRKIELFKSRSIVCPLCPYNKSENGKHHGKHGRNNRYKNHRS